MSDPLDPDTLARLRSLHSMGDDAGIWEALTPPVLAALLDAVEERDTLAEALAFTAGSAPARTNLYCCGPTQLVRSALEIADRLNAERGWTK